MGHQPKRKEGSRDKISSMIVLNHISYSYYSTRTTLEVGPLLMWHNQLKRFGTIVQGPLVTCQTPKGFGTMFW